MLKGLFNSINAVISKKFTMQFKLNVPHCCIKALINPYFKEPCFIIFLNDFKRFVIYPAHKATA